MTASELRQSLRIKSVFSSDTSLSALERFQIQFRRKGKWKPLVFKNEPDAPNEFDTESEAKARMKQVILRYATDLKDKRHADPVAA